MIGIGFRPMTLDNRQMSAVYRNGCSAETSVTKNNSWLLLLYIVCLPWGRSGFGIRLPIRTSCAIWPQKVLPGSPSRLAAQARYHRHESYGLLMCLLICITTPSSLRCIFSMTSFTCFVQKKPPTSLRLSVAALIPPDTSDEVIL